MDSFERLTSKDQSALERFLVRHADSSMFMLSNVASEGLSDDPLDGAVYVARWAYGEIRGVVSQTERGALFLQAPGWAAQLAVAAVRNSRRHVSSVLGLRAQVADAFSALKLDDLPKRLFVHERLHTLDLEHALAPRAVPGAELRLARVPDLALVAAWRARFRVEAGGEVASESLDKSAAIEAARLCGGGSTYILSLDGRPAAMGVVNARYGDKVQIGGIYTPPLDRGRGLGRQLVFEVLRVASRDRGVRSATMFVGTENQAAQRCATALGFRATADEYTHAIFAEEGGYGPSRALRDLEARPLI